jgi:hypothetical protein
MTDPAPYRPIVRDSPPAKPARARKTKPATTPPETAPAVDPEEPTDA